jgi:hypothetical protein
MLSPCDGVPNDTESACWKKRWIDVCAELTNTRKWSVTRIDEEGVGVTEEPMGPRMT